MRAVSRTTYKYHPYIDEYMDAVDGGTLVVCQEHKQLVKLLRGKLAEPGVVIDADAIEKSVDVPAKYFSFTLLPWERFVNAFIFGVRRTDGRLLFDRFLLYMGRGAGKDAFMSHNSFFMLSGYHGIQNYDIDIVATSEGQAKNIFDDVYDAIGNPAYAQKMKKVFDRTKLKITHRRTKSSLSFNTSNAKTKDGKRTGAVIFNEIHAHENYENIKVCY